MKKIINFSQYKYFIFLIIIIGVGAFFRLYNLGNAPVGMTWDEVAIGYNGFSIFHTRRDEWLQKIPISFRSFGDYKAPLAIYISALSTAVFDLNTWAVRMPFALSGILSILLIALFTKEWLGLFTKLQKTSIEWLSIFASFSLTLSPWHVLFSRVGFESGQAMCILLLSGYLGLLSLRNFNNRKVHYTLLVSSSLFLSLTLYSYHSAKLFSPLALFLLGVWWLIKKKPIKSLVFALTSFSLGILPLLYDSYFGQGLTRASVTIFSHEQSFWPIISKLLSNFASYMSFDFLLFGTSDSLRHSTGVIGVLFLPTLVLSIVALSSFIVSITKLSRSKMIIQHNSLIIFSSLWILLGFLPAVIGQETHHANRSLLALPGFILLSVVGLHLSISYFRKTLLKFVIIIILIAVTLLQFGFFWSYYNHAYQKLISREYLDGYLDMTKRVWQIHDNGYNSLPVDQILVSSEFGQPYIYFLFSKKVLPFEYHGGLLSRFLFPDQISIDDLSRNNTLLVFGPQAKDIEFDTADEVIYFKSGEPMFYLKYTGKTTP